MMPNDSLMLLVEKCEIKVPILMFTSQHSSCQFV
jgi:hypothetical protein